MSRLASIALVLVALLAVNGCAPTPPSEPSSIEGVITAISSGSGDVLPTILVEVPDGPDAAKGFVSDKASVRITEKTRVFTIGGALTDASALERTGLGVRVWLGGPIAESYPVQAEASAVQLVP